MQITITCECGNSETVDLDFRGLNKFYIYTDRYEGRNVVCDEEKGGCGFEQELNDED